MIVTQVLYLTKYFYTFRSSRNFSGNFVIDEDILKEEGLSNFEQYACIPGAKLLPDFFLVRPGFTEHMICWGSHFVTIKPKG